MDATEEIKSRISIEDLVGRYVDLKRSGASLKGLCPFHQEKTPSFYVSPQRGTFHCFGCSRGGDVFSFLMEAEHVAFPDALKQLAEEAGVVLEAPRRQTPSLRASLLGANQRALDFFRAAYESPDGKRAAQYLAGRSFGREAVERFNLGYAPGGGDILVRRLQEEGIEPRILIAAGLAIEDESGGRLRDRFRGRLMFPIRNASREILGFGGRALGEAQPKYLNSPQTEIFDKSSVLFGIDLASDQIRQSGRAVLVEGYLDAIRAHMGGFPATVASLGTAVTARQLAALGRLTGTVILALDPDPAGQSAAARTALAALTEVTESRKTQPGTSQLDLRIARLPGDAGDPDEVIRESPELWEGAINRSIPAFEFYFTRTMDALDRSSDIWRQQAVDQLLPAIQQLSPSPGFQAVWIERLAAETAIDPRSLQRAMPSAPRRRTRSRENVVARTTARALASDPASEIEQGLMALLLQILVIPADAADALTEASLLDPDHQELLNYLLSWRNYDYELFRSSLPTHLTEVADLLRGRAVPLPAEGKTSQAVRLHLIRLSQARVQRELTRAQQLLESLPTEEQLAQAASIARLRQEQHRISRELAAAQRNAEHYGTIDHDSGS